MKRFLRILGHAALGGAGVAIVSIPSGAPLTSKNVLLPIAASALTSVISLFAAVPKNE